MPTTRTSRLLARLDGCSRAFVFAAAVPLLALVGLLDYASGIEVSFSLFYLAPVALVAWRLGRRAGVAAALSCAAVWLWIDRLGGHQYSSPAILYWNAAVRLGFFLVVTFLLASLHRAWQQAERMNRTDPLTGIVNGRHFRELAGREAERARRYGRPFTLAFLDLDGFKQVNDRLGHAVGDELLRAAAGLLVRRLRASDVVGRLGGDEFALLLPETGPEEARGAVEKLRAALRTELAARGWPVTASVGVVTLRRAPRGAEDVLAIADGLMYEVKRAGKDAASYAVFDGESAGGSQAPRRGHQRGTACR